MLPFWLWPYPGRLISGFAIVLLVYFLTPDLLTQGTVLWVIALAYLFGHWVWYYWKKHVNRKIIAFDVGGVIVSGDYFTETVRPMPGMYEAITNIRKRYVTAVLSNNNRLVDPGFQAQFKAGDMFDHIFYSSDLGVKKPDENIFRKFAAQMRVSPSRIIFFDDDASNVAAAKKVGYDAHVFKSAHQVTEIVKGH